MLIFNVIDLCKLAYGRVLVQDMCDIVQTSPKSKDEMKADLGAEIVKPFRKAMMAAQGTVAVTALFPLLLKPL